MNEAKVQYRNKVISKLKEQEDAFYQDEAHHITEFIRDYKAADVQYIRFDWNKKHGKEFMDVNSSFRDKVAVYYLLNCQDNKNVLLAKDLFVEQAKHDKEAWAAKEYLFLLGQRLLEVSGTQFIYEFLEGVFASMDTYGCCLHISLNEPLVYEIKREIKRLLEASAGDLIAARLLNNGLQYVDNFLR